MPFSTGPKSCLEYLGIEIDTVTLERHLAPTAQAGEIVDEPPGVHTRAKMLHKPRHAVTHWSSIACCHIGAFRTHIYETNVKSANKPG